ncbi:hypothetical protein AB4Z40_34245 [Bosea sp. 2YAB26]|uniref:hypothetical protein n=1 Tax=Bosea sp. 2YAB26 TaxID=3237478 RepID=UPI003F93AED9
MRPEDEAAESSRSARSYFDMSLQFVDDCTDLAVSKRFVDNGAKGESWRVRGFLGVTLFFLFERGSSFRSITISSRNGAIGDAFTLPEPVDGAYSFREEALALSMINRYRIGYAFS